MVFPGGIEYGQELNKGFWGVPTSTIDWCEENYTVSPYIAEAINTTTNAFFILLAAYALRNIIANKLEFRFILSAMGFMLVGIGSWLFHMTLRYDFQLLDELPMIYATCIPCWSVFQTKKSKSQSTAIGITIFCGALTLTAVYLHYKNPTIHQAAYGGLNALIVIKSVIQTGKFVPDPVAKANLRRTLYMGLAEFLLAWILWNMDIHFCSFWRVLRRYIGMPYGFVFELHGWWHLLTGSAVYKYLVYLEYLRTFALETNYEYEYVWKYNFFPVCQLRGSSPLHTTTTTTYQQADKPVKHD